jgi:excisionase family DNA binding protein
MEVDAKELGHVRSRSEETLSQLMTVQQFAAKLDVTKMTLRAMTQSELAVIKIGEKFFHRESDVDAWVMRRHSSHRRHEGVPVWR